jgi:hypothetical protein
MSNDLKATAFHEAGHAVIAHLHGRRFKCVSIQPSEDCKGFVEYYDARIIEEILGGTHCNSRLLEHPDEEMLIVEASSRPWQDTSPRRWVSLEALSRAKWNRTESISRAFVKL